MSQIIQLTSTKLMEFDFKFEILWGIGLNFLGLAYIQSRVLSNELWNMNKQIITISSASPIILRPCVITGKYGVYYVNSKNMVLNLLIGMKL